MTKTFTLAGLAAVIMDTETDESNRITRFYFGEGYSLLSISSMQYTRIRDWILHQHPQFKDIVTDFTRFDNMKVSSLMNFNKPDFGIDDWAELWEDKFGKRFFDIDDWGSLI
jgi:hypothetical protein